MGGLVTERIGIDHGAAMLRGVLPVEQVIDLLTVGVTFDEIIQRFPRLEREDILACIEFAYSK